MPESFYALSGLLLGFDPKLEHVFEGLPVHARTPVQPVLEVASQQVQLGELGVWPQLDGLVRHSGAALGCGRQVLTHGGQQQVTMSGSLHQRVREVGVGGGVGHSLKKIESNNEWCLFLVQLFRHD